MDEITDKTAESLSEDSTENAQDAEGEGAAPEANASAETAARPLFPHRPWMTGIVLVLAVLAVLGGLNDPLWFWIGLPFILVLALYVYVCVRDWLSGAKSDLPE